MNKSLVLLKTLLLSTSQWNIYKNCKDKKKRGRVVGNAIGMGVLYLMLMGYSIAQCVGYGMMGLESSIPVIEAFRIFKKFKLDVVPYEYICTCESFDELCEKLKGLC